MTDKTEIAGRGPMEQFLDEMINKHGYDSTCSDAVKEFIFDIRNGIREQDARLAALVNAAEAFWRLIDATGDDLNRPAGYVEAFMVLQQALALAREVTP